MSDEVCYTPTRSGVYMGSRAQAAGCELVILGAPLDTTASFMPGARFGPERIRAVSSVLEEYSPALNRDLADISYYDAGDVPFACGNVPAALAAIRAAVADIVQSGAKPVVIGGEHLVTLPVVEAVYAEYPDLRVVQFDAHADLRPHYLGEQHSHATVMRRIADLIGPRRVYQFGIRSGGRDEFTYGRNNTNFFPDEIIQPLESVMAELTDHPIYVTVDIDVVDPGFAPGTGTPEPGGCDSGVLLLAVEMLAELNVIGADVVEVCPPADHGIVTSVLAAKLIRQFLLGMGRSCS